MSSNNALNYLEIEPTNLYNENISYIIIYLFLDLKLSSRALKSLGIFMGLGNFYEQTGE